MDIEKTDSELQKIGSLFNDFKIALISIAGVATTIISGYDWIDVQLEHIYKRPLPAVAIVVFLVMSLICLTVMNFCKLLRHNNQRQDSIDESLKKIANGYAKSESDWQQSHTDHQQLIDLFKNFGETETGK